MDNEDFTTLRHDQVAAILRHQGEPQSLPKPPSTPDWTHAKIQKGHTPKNAFSFNRTIFSIPSQTRRLLGSAAERLS